ncbi:M50 family metallopeptidase [Anaerobacillus sp. CMMVII]|uniref:site-2 protease family protein n=1 Tax=Anaerobacillus sp. CMMVII TaxID=2755588 RepID=UPI0021B782CA|nr:site-2 protease family protein [Anaerobacillus sp. CMMVII]MCT8139069.1 M50 family metallopeptidase [Anaerobacillus sp. CMMVII]
MIFLFIVICFFTILPITLILHELGHFFCAIGCNAKKITVTIGTGFLVKNFKCNNTNFFFRILPLGGNTSYELAETAKCRQVIISLGGPLLNGMVACLLILPGIGYGDEYLTLWFQWLAFLNFWMFIINVTPFKMGRYHSDGWLILNAWKVTN